MIAIVLLARVLLGAIFLMSALAKLATPRGFAQDVPAGAVYLAASRLPANTLREG